MWTGTWKNILLKQDGPEAGVEGANSLSGQDLSEAINETPSVAGSRDETDTGSLQGAKGDGSEELGRSSGHGVHGGTVLTGLLKANEIDSLLLEELVTTELEGALDKVACERRTEARS